MKVIKFLLVVTLIWSCSESKENSDKFLINAESEENVLFDDHLNSSKESKSIDYLELSRKKLQEVYDLNSLKNNYPNFEEDVSIRLTDLLLTEVNIDKSLDSVKIKSIQQIGANTYVGANKTKIHLKYDIEANGRLMTDSIYAVIYEYVKLVENKSVISVEVKFISEDID